MTDQESQMVREIELPAPADQVWEALTDPEQVEAWFGGTVDWDLRPGGQARFSEDEDHARNGEIDEVSPGRRLRFRWWPADTGDEPEDGASVVQYELNPVPGGTRLTVTETQMSAGRTTAMHVCASTGTWDVRLIGLWLGCHPGLCARV